MNDLEKDQLEAKIAFLERHVEEQDKVILAIQNRIDVLQTTVSQLEDSMKTQKESQAETYDSEKPPHY